MAAIIVKHVTIMTNPQPNRKGTNKSAEANVRPSAHNAKTSRIKEMYRQFNTEQPTLDVIN
jgi:hypothetical protein